MSTRTLAAASVVLAAALVGCRGGISEKPPIHLVLDMDFQPKLKSQSESTFEGWPDHRGMRLPVANTVARSEYIGDPKTLLQTYDANGDQMLDMAEARNLEVAHVFEQADRNGDWRLDLSELQFAASLYVYRTDDGFVKSNPLPATEEVLERGRQRFTINCSVCHGVTGRGGMVARRWPVKVPNLVDDPDPTTRQRITGYSDAELVGIMTEGHNTMPSYAQQVDIADRWAIAHYVKALQKYFSE